MPNRNGVSHMKFLVSRIEDWSIVAKQVASTLAPGMMILLSGPLGAGKTTFVQALAKELGSKKVPKSPSFALVRTYALKNAALFTRLVHVDAYRLESEREALALGLDELAEPGSLLVIEWPEKLGGWLKHLRNKRLEINITVDPRHDTRHVRIR